MEHHQQQQQQQQSGLATPSLQFAAADGHPTPAANPTPTHSQPPPSHPSYAEMITAAILWDSAQGKAGGSSKRAIAKYIDRVYSNLPPTHSSLLTHHLRRLKNSGHLVMIKNSYQLPVVAAATSGSPAAVPLRSVGPSPSSPEPFNSAPTAKKRPGRPAKLKSPAQQQPTSVSTPMSMAVVPLNTPVGNGSVSGKRPRGRPPRQQTPQQQVQQPPVVAEVPFVVQPMYAADAVDSASPVDNGQSAKRRPGRPPKKEQQFVQTQIQPSDHGPMAVPVNGVDQKRRSGRPPVKANVVAGAGARAPKPRGRPKRNALGPASKSIGKKMRGRPPMQGGVSLGGRVAGGKRVGRPSKGSVAPPKLVRAMYRGKPRGRPKKNASTMGKQTSEQVAANKELMRKVENMQATIRDAVFVLRPCMSNENATDALKALQQLEDLSAMNLTAIPTSTPVKPPAASVGAIVQVEANTTPVPTPQKVPAIPPATMTVPAMAPSVMPFSVVAPPMTENAPLFAPTIETQQPASWIPSSEAQL